MYIYIYIYIYVYIYIHIKFVTPFVSYARSILPCLYIAMSLYCHVKEPYPTGERALQTHRNTQQYTATHCNTLYPQKGATLPAQEPCRHGTISRRAGRNQIFIDIKLCLRPCRALFVFIEGLYMARGCHRDMALFLGEQGNGNLHCRALLVYM